MSACKGCKREIFLTLVRELTERYDFANHTHLRFAVLRGARLFSERAESFVCPHECSGK